MATRYVITGAPGSGKTTLLHALRARGHAVVDEAATEVIANQHALGIEVPWTRLEFVDLIVTRQHAQRVTADALHASVQFYDRLLGFIESTLARRISYEESVAFERVHEAVYREHGFDLVDVPATSVSERVALIEAQLTHAELHRRLSVPDDLRLREELVFGDLAARQATDEGRAQVGVVAVQTSAASNCSTMCEATATTRRHRP